MSALFIGAGTALVGTAYSIYNAESQKAKANKIEKSLRQPNYEIPKEFYENRNIARQLAQLGLPQQQYNNQLNQINANQADAIAAASRSANPGAAIGAITSQANAATNNLNAEDAQARLTNQRYYIDQNAQLAGQKLQQQQANVFDPYTQKYNEMQAYRGAGMQNENTAFQDLSQLGGYALQYGLKSNSGQTFGQAGGMQPLQASAPTTNSFQPLQTTSQLTGIGYNQQPIGFNYTPNNPNMPMQLNIPPYQNPYFPQ